MSHAPEDIAYWIEPAPASTNPQINKRIKEARRDPTMIPIPIIIPQIIIIFILPWIFLAILTANAENAKNDIPTADSINPRPLASVKFKTIGGRSTEFIPCIQFETANIATSVTKPFLSLSHSKPSRRSRYMFLMFNWFFCSTFFPLINMIDARPIKQVITSNNITPGSPKNE